MREGLQHSRWRLRAQPRRDKEAAALKARAGVAKPSAPRGSEFTCGIGNAGSAGESRSNLRPAPWAMLGDDAAALPGAYSVEDVPLGELDLTPGLIGWARAERGDAPLS